MRVLFTHPEPPERSSEYPAHRGRLIIQIGCAAFLFLSGLGVALAGLAMVLR